MTKLIRSALAVAVRDSQKVDRSQSTAARRADLNVRLDPCGFDFIAGPLTGAPMNGSNVQGNAGCAPSLY